MTSESMTASPPLKIQNLTKYYGTLCAVNNVSFEVLPGEIFGLLGPNGAGKTSIISTIMTICEPTSGNAFVFDHDVTKKPKIIKMLTGCVPQELVNHGFFTLEEILTIYSSYYGLSDNDKQVEYLIDKLALHAHRKKRIKELSGGLKRRLLIAKALLHKPKLVLLDEPTAGVDVELRSILWKFVKELSDQGVSILLTTHYLEEAEELCDRVGILDKGILKAVGETEQLVKKLTKREVFLSLNAPIPSIKHPQLCQQDEHQLVFQIPASEDLGELIAMLPMDIRNIKDIRIREGRLEDAFQSIVGSQYEP